MWAFPDWLSQAFGPQGEMGEVVILGLGVTKEAPCKRDAMIKAQNHGYALCYHSEVTGGVQTEGFASAFITSEPFFFF